jgi:hypothetical protein|tara:strand:+ start:730 stop:1338 length:609 start_codon:yes stop_codon:yes gene_type:complete
MSHCFGSSSNLSAKDYINKKRNYTNFCDLRKKFISNGYNATGSSIACLNGSGIVYQYRSQSIQLEITKGMEQFSQVFRPQDISKNYIGQQIKNHFCSPYDICNNNIDISNNYYTHAAINTLATAGNTTQLIEIDADGGIINRYAERRIVPSDLSGNSADAPFASGKQILYTLCPIRDSGRVQVVIASELIPPTPSSFEFVFV